MNIKATILFMAVIGSSAMAMDNKRPNEDQSQDSNKRQQLPQFTAELPQNFGAQPTHHVPLPLGVSVVRPRQRPSYPSFDQQALQQRLSQRRQRQQIQNNPWDGVSSTNGSF